MVVRLSQRKTDMVKDFSRLKRHLGTITEYLQGGEVTRGELNDAIECAQGLFVCAINRWAKADNALPPLELEVLAVKGDRIFIAHRLNDGWHDESGNIVAPDYWQIVQKPEQP